MKKTSERLYDTYLKRIESKMGRKTTTGIELERMGQKLFGGKFHGVYASDQIPQMQPNQYAILNLDPSHKPGVHWVAYVKGNNRQYLYDSFGRQSLKIAGTLRQKSSGILEQTESDPEQKKLEENCGQRSLAALMVYDRLGWNGLKWI